MMALDFPASPIIGQVYPTPAQTGIPQYVWDGQKWDGVDDVRVPVYTDGSNAMVGPLLLSMGSPASNDEAVSVGYLNTKLGGYVKLIGDTMTGPLIIADAVGSVPRMQLNQGNDDTDAAVDALRNGTMRWRMSFALQGPEGTGNTGNDFGLLNYNNAGGPATDFALYIRRKDGYMSMSGDAAGIDINPKLATSYAQIVLNKPVASSNAMIVAMTNRKKRWEFRFADGFDETGGNVGSDWSVGSYADDGSPLAAVLSAKRNGDAYWGYRLFYGNTVGASAFHFGANAGATWWACSTDSWRWEFTRSNGQMSWIRGTSGQVNVALVPNGELNIIGTIARKTGAGQWADISDIRIKDVLGPYESGLAAIKALRPIRYTFKGNDKPVVKVGDPPVFGGHDDTTTEFIGLVAQEAEQVMPEMVTQGDGWVDGEPVKDLRTLDPSALIWAVVNAIQELSERVEALE